MSTVWTPRYMMDKESHQDLDVMDQYLRHQINHRIPSYFPIEHYEKNIHRDYRARSIGEWLFLFLRDRSITHHKKERILKILFEVKDRGIKLVDFIPLTFEVTSEPKGRTGKPARTHQVTLSLSLNWFCDCEWQGTVADDTCTHILAARAFMFLKTNGGRKPSSKIQGAS